MTVIIVFFIAFNLLLWGVPWWCVLLFTLFATTTTEDK